MIKKTGNIAIIILLLIATGGVPLTRHYCGSSFVSFSIFSTPKPCCDNDCNKCHNDFKFSKVGDDFEAGTSIYANASSIDIANDLVFFVNLFVAFQGLTLPDYSNHRTFHISGAGSSPAFTGNFRC